MATGVTHDERLIAPLELRLDKLRRGLATWLLVDGGARWVWTLLIIAALDFGLDWFLHLDRLQRTAILLAAAGFLLFRGWRLLFRIPRKPISGEALCAQVQQKNPSLGQSLLTAFELSHREESDEAEEKRIPVSALLRERAIREGVSAAEGVAFEGVLNRPRYARNWRRLIVGLACLIGFQVWVTRQPESLGAIWLARNVYLQEVDWPQDTYLQVVGEKDGIVRGIRGEDWLAAVQVRENSVVIPEQVTMEFRTAGQKSAQVMKKKGEAEFELTVSAVRQAMEFRVRGGDATTRWMHLELVEPPAIDELKLAVQMPAYAGGESIALPAGQGPYPILEGSSLLLQGSANKKLSKVTLLAGEHSHELVVDASSGTGFEGVVSANDLQTATYELRLTDVEGLTTKQGLTFGIRLMADNEPKLKLKLLGVGGMVTKKALIPWEVRITDDYGIATLAGKYRATKTDGKQEETGESKANAEGESFAVDLDGLKFPSKAITAKQAIDLQTLPVGEGSNLTLWMTATDNDAVGSANVGRSADVSLKVVTEEDFRQSILEREKELRLELERQLKLQEELMTEVRAIRVVQKSDEVLEREGLVVIVRRQKGVAAALASIGNRLQGIAEEIAINRIEGPEAKLETRLRKEIIAPLTNVAEVRVPVVITGLEKGGREAKTGMELGKELDQVLAEQMAVCEDLKRILAAMSESEDFQKAVNMLYEIQRAQQDVLRRTQQEKDRRIREALEPKKP